jgi:hypothetical protein
MQITFAGEVWGMTQRETGKTNKPETTDKKRSAMNAPNMAISSDAGTIAMMSQPDYMMYLQRTVGNQATQRLVQQRPQSPNMQRSVQHRTSTPTVMRDKAANEQKANATAGGIQTKVAGLKTKLVGLSTDALAMVSQAQAQPQQQQGQQGQQQQQQPAGPTEAQITAARQNRAKMKDVVQDMFNAIKPLSSVPIMTTTVLQVLEEALTQITSGIADVDTVSNWLHTNAQGKNQVKNKEWPKIKAEIQGWTLSLGGKIQEGAGTLSEGYEAYSSIASSVGDSVETIQNLVKGDNQELLKMAKDSGVEDMGGGFVKGEKPEFKDWIKSPLSAIKTAIKEAMPDSVISAAQKIAQALSYIPFVSAIAGMITGLFKFITTARRYAGFKKSEAAAKSRLEAFAQQQQQVQQGQQPPTPGPEKKADESILYAVKKTYRAYLSALSSFVLAIIKGVSRLVTFFSGGTSAMVTESIAMATDIINVLGTIYRKGKGIWKQFRGTRGKNRALNASDVFDAAVAGNAVDDKNRPSLELMIQVGVNVKPALGGDSTAKTIAKGAGAMALNTVSLGISSEVAALISGGKLAYTPEELLVILLKAKDNSLWKQQIIGDLSEKMKSF